MEDEGKGGNLQLYPSSREREPLHKPQKVNVAKTNIPPQDEKPRRSSTVIALSTDCADLYATKNRRRASILSSAGDPRAHANHQQLSAQKNTMLSVILSALSLGQGCLTDKHEEEAKVRYNSLSTGKEREKESTKNQYLPPAHERERGRDRRSRTYPHPTSPIPAELAYSALSISRESDRPTSPSQSIRDERRRSIAAVTPHHTPTRGPGSTRRCSVAPEAADPDGPGKRYSIPEKRRLMPA
ncbi:hypothetical protein F5J12DRAFT_928628 [Pisolithus orientalis]|uniref:uncharacterized protein n=1 Tax=Pisolithus orientalis TaxID=936130 RepID=UPI002224CAF3|nr:uncharacterized protein F5J12DRAFT_928628 [Pisolithus orientalis]KAI5999787.1 hypothetical protein F5J12DRAFT_928628 [Pisolithus orientalis]